MEQILSGRLVNSLAGGGTRLEITIYDVPIMKWG